MAEKANILVEQLETKSFIVIPCYNSGKYISGTVNQLREFGYSNIIVVNDGSTDDSHEIIETLPVSYARHLVNLGQGAALRTGTKIALQQGAETIVHFDADGQHQASDIASMLEALNNVDIVIGSRFIKENAQVPWSKKYFILKPAIAVNWVFSGLWLTDAHNGFRVMNRTAAEKINITQNMMAHATEILSEIKKHNLRYQEVPVNILYNEYGQNWKGGIRIIFDLIRQNLL